MRSVRFFVVVALVSIASDAAADDPLEVTGHLVTTKKGPAFRGQARAPGAASDAATFDLEQRSYGVTLDRKHLTGEQNVSLGGGTREMVLRATDGVREVVWTLSGKPPGTGRNRKARGRAEHCDNGRLVQVEEVVVKPPLNGASRKRRRPSYAASAPIHATPTRLTTHATVRTYGTPPQ